MGIQMSFPLDIYPEVRLLDHMKVLFLIFEESPHCFKKWLYQFIFTPTEHKGSLSPPSSTFFTSFLFYNSHSNRCKVIFYCGFWFAFPWWLVMLASFHVPVSLFYILFGKICLFRSFTYFLIGLFMVLFLNCMSSLYTLDINSLSTMWLANISTH